MRPWQWGVEWLRDDGSTFVGAMANAPGARHMVEVGNGAGECSGPACTTAQRVTDAVLAAAVPFIREVIAAEIEARTPHIHTHSSADNCEDCQWIVWAARIARGATA